MKVAFVCPRYYPYIGGIEKRLKEVCERLVKKGFEIDVLTTDPSGKLRVEEVINGVRIKRFKALAPNESYYFSPALRRYLKRYAKNYEIIDAHSYHALPALYAAEAKYNNKLIFTPHFHGRGHTFIRNLLHIPYRLIARKIFEKADAIICHSKYEQELVKMTFGIEDNKFVLIPSGIDPQEFQGIEKPKVKRGKMILYVGRLEKYKGVEYLVRVLPKLNGEFFLTIIGTGPYKKNLVKLIKKLKLQDRVILHESLPRSELIKKYAEADVFVILSKYEAFCVSVAEALASKTPCIVANTSALREWIDNENCFGISYPIDLNKLAKLIEEVANIQVKNLELPTWDEVAEEIRKVYERLS